MEPAQLPPTLATRPIATPGATQLLAIENSNTYGKIVWFKHPGPTGRGTAIFTLPKVEFESGAKVYGVQAGPALDACRIIACNQPGYLSESSIYGESPIRDPDVVLMADEYFFHLENLSESSDYAICASFEDWGFPHGEVPERWMEIVTQHPQLAAGSDYSFTQRVISRDPQCVVSGYKDGSDAAHLVPQASENWVRITCGPIDIPY